MKELAYQVVRYTKVGKFDAVISGMGRNRGKIEYNHSLRTAKKYAALLRKEDPSFDYRVETSGTPL